MPDKHKSKRKPDDAEQSKRFLEAADKAEAEETEESAARAFKTVVKHSDRRMKKRQ